MDMATRSVYFAYKRDTSQLLYWIIRTSNSILKLTTASDNDPAQVNTTGQITVADLVALSHLIARHVNPAPRVILRLFHSVIEARTAAHRTFQQLATDNPSFSIEQSNATHRHFIDALTDAFHMLGGRDWNPADDCSADGATADANGSHSKKDLDHLLLSNQFMALDLSNTAGTNNEAEESDDSHSHPERGPDPGQKRRRQAKPGKGKKGRRGKKSKIQQQSALAKEALLDGVPLESYCIIQDGEGVDPDYLMAVYDIISEWMTLRQRLQYVWRRCAYNGLNSAVAGAVSQLAIAMVRRSATEIFAGFPAHDDYETIIQLVTGADLEKDVSQTFTLTAQTMTPEGEVGPVLVTHVDIKEQFMVDTYRNLIDFLDDFRKTRSGKPTKRMLGELRDWDPEFNLHEATKEERIRWRRCYTINWLYDLVNLFSFVAVNQKSPEGEPHVLEDTDWSPTGSWAHCRRLFGLNEFAGMVTSLAMQKQGTDIGKRILPDLIFQLQAITDSFMVSRGWLIGDAGDHILEPPPQDFRPLRDIDLFLDRNNDRLGHGFLQSAIILKRSCADDATLHHNPTRHENTDTLLDRLAFEFSQWLSGDVMGRETELGQVPPSRFSGTNGNGLWEYSPFLCGAGLMESLDLAYLAGMFLWDTICEPIVLIHLHNMLVKEGYLEEPVGLFERLQDIFADTVFISGKVPSSNFSDALITRLQVARLSKGSGPKSRRRGQGLAPIPRANRNYGPFEALGVEHNRFFRTKSVLSMYRQSKWDIMAIPDADIMVPSALFRLRICGIPQTVDPITQQARLEDTDLVKRARAMGITDEAMLETIESLCGCPEGAAGKPPPSPAHATTTAGDSSDDANDTSAAAASAQAPEHEAHPPAPQRRKNTGPNRSKSKTPTKSKINTASSPPPWCLTGPEILDFAERDLTYDITGAGRRPLSAINYAAVTCVMMRLFEIVEEELAKRRNPVYVRVYEQEVKWAKSKRVGLVGIMLAWADGRESELVEGAEECVELMVAALEHFRVGVDRHFYWDFEMEDLEGR